MLIFILLYDGQNPVLRYGLFQGAIWALSGDDKAHIRVRNGAFRTAKCTILRRHGFWTIFHYCEKGFFISFFSCSYFYIVSLWRHFYRSDFNLKVLISYLLFTLFQHVPPRLFRAVLYNRRALRIHRFLACRWPYAACMLSHVCTVVVWQCACSGLQKSWFKDFYAAVVHDISEFFCKFATDKRHLPEHCARTFPRFGDVTLTASGVCSMSEETAAALL